MKNCKKTWFFDDFCFFQFLQFFWFRVHISAQNLQIWLQWTLSHLLTPLAARVNSRMNSFWVHTAIVNLLLITFWTLGICFKCCTIIVNNLQYILSIYTKSLVNADSFYTNFANTTFQKISVSHLTEIPSLTWIISFFINRFPLTCLKQFLVNMTFSKNQK